MTLRNFEPSSPTRLHCIGLRQSFDTWGVATPPC